MARRIVDEAQRERTSHESDMAAELEEYRYQAYRDAWARINEYREEQTAKTAANVKLIEEAARDGVAEMERTAGCHRDEWVEYLYVRILEGEIG